jgi:hypothetical protein
VLLSVFPQLSRETQPSPGLGCLAERVRVRSPPGSTVFGFFFLVPSAHPEIGSHLPSGRAQLPGSNLHHTAFFGESSASRCNNPSKERLPPFLIQSSSQFRFFCRVLVCGLLQGFIPVLLPGLTLELPDQKTRVFLAKIALLR